MQNNTVNKKIIRWGIIGCGNVTEVKSGPAYQLTLGFDLVAVMRRNTEKLVDYAQRHHIAKYYTNADQLINDAEVEAIYIATPPDTHKFYALKVAAVGKPCCIEKPLSPSYKESYAVYKAFQEKNIPLFVAYYRRSLPRFNQVKQWLNEKKIGSIRHISWTFSKAPNNLDVSKIYNWRTDAAIALGGYFDDLASHGLDLFVFLLGNIKEAKGISTNQQKLYTAKDAVSACWLHEHGITGSGSWNFGADRREDSVTIFGSEGKIQFAVFQEASLILETQNQRQELFIENPKHIQIHHVENMKKHLFNENYRHPSNGETATHTNWIMDKILGNI